MNAVFKAWPIALLLLIALSPVAHADNLPAPLVDSARFPSLVSVTGDDIVLMYFQGSVTDIRGISIAATEAHDKIDDLFGGYPYRTTVVVAGTDSEFRLLINVGDAPNAVKSREWNVGSNGLIVTKSPAMLSDFKQVLAHQMARIAVRTRQNESYRSLPEWFQDGVASCVAGDITQDQRNAAVSMASSGTWMPPEGLERAYKNMTIYNYEEQEYRNARAEAATIVSNIGSLYGTRALIGIIDDYTVSGNFTRAFANRTSFTPEGMSEAFLGSLSGTDKSTPGNQAASGTNGSKPGNSPSPGAVVEGDERQDAAGATPTSGSGTASWPPAGDVLLYGFIAAVNVAGVCAVLLILRRNWH